ncbi:MAG: uncharacterized protein K0Q74_310 [Gammaproteobacteria bacterium]|jgi:cell division protein FtsN|nr:uncharacterized protein [Gammaproteobacteria bacterium]
MARRRKKRKSAQTPYQGSAWLILGLLLGLGVAAAMNWESVRKYLITVMDIEVEKPQSTVASAVPSKSKPTEKPKKQNKSPEFDFYDILANKKVDASKGPMPSEKRPSKSEQEAPAASVSAVGEVPARSPTMVAETAPSVPNADTAPNNTSKPIEPGQRYIVQIASFSTYQEADRLRAELTMNGFDVHIQSIQHDNKARYRVNMGPYASKELAVAKQADLRQHNVSSLLVKQ